MPIFEITARYQMYLGPGNQINKGERLTMNIHTIGVQPVTLQRYGPVCILSSKTFVKSNKEDCFCIFQKVFVPLHLWKNKLRTFQKHYMA